MKHVKRSVLLWYSCREMYDLVTGVERYPEFLPWCSKAELLERNEAAVTARLSLAYAGVRHAFTTRNELLADESVHMQLVDGPFSMLDGVWSFKPIASAGAERSACRVELDLRYSFASRALETVVSPVFDRVANTLVDSFVSRAEQVYGAR
ncbi:MAG: type II toxin-antitoxin system RatA family toxin [Rubrivivax sp.]|jgi:ribosome-associated toxin RatA of RatAB toxin-antitoxin module